MAQGWQLSLVPQELPSDHLRRLGGLNPSALVRLAIKEAPAEAPLAVPGYEIIGALGSGGMGEVYRARQVSLDREVAVKVLRAELENTGWLPERFEREARTMATLRHPNLVTVHDCVRLGDGSIAIVMELVDGGTLREKVSVAPEGLPMELAVRWIREIAEGLHAAHGAGVVHRDIKPENVLIDDDGHARVSDFGMAFSAGAATARLTQTGTALGTVGYMAPEQLRAQEVDARSDIFSLGVLCYEMLTGHLPQGSFSPVRELRAEVPEMLDRFVIAALRPLPDRRPASLLAAIEMLRDLERHPYESRFSRRKLLATGAAALAVGAGTWWGLNRGPKPNPAGPRNSPASPPAPESSLAKPGEWNRVKWPEDPALKAVRGGWRIENNSIISNDDMCILPLVSQMPQAWMARMRFRRLSGIYSVEVFFRHRNGFGSCLVGGWSLSKGGVQVIDGRSLENEGGFALPLVNGQTYEMTMEVRPDVIRMWVSNQEGRQFKDERQITNETLTVAMPWYWSPGPGDAALSIGSWKSPTQFEWLDWREIV